jgi:hypothetical protein
MARTIDALERYRPTLAPGGGRRYSGVDCRYTLAPNIGPNHHTPGMPAALPMLSVSLLMFAGCFWAAHWLDERRLAKRGTGRP